MERTIKLGFLSKFVNIAKSSKLIKNRETKWKKE